MFFCDISIYKQTKITLNNNIYHIFLIMSIYQNKGNTAKILLNIVKSWVTDVLYKNH